MERVFFSRPDLGLDGWVSASAISADGHVRPLLEEFHGDSLTVEYEDVPAPGTQETQQAQRPDTQRVEPQALSDPEQEQQPSHPESETEQLPEPSEVSTIGEGNRS